MHKHEGNAAWSSRPPPRLQGRGGAAFCTRPPRTIPAGAARPSHPSRLVRSQGIAGAALTAFLSSNTGSVVHSQGIAGAAPRAAPSLQPLSPLGKRCRPTGEMALNVLIVKGVPLKEPLEPTDGGGCALRRLAMRTLRCALPARADGGRRAVGRSAHLRRRLVLALLGQLQRALQQRDLVRLRRARHVQGLLRGAGHARGGGGRAHGGLQMISGRK